jgi:hypothetical protein
MIIPAAQLSSNKHDIPVSDGGGWEIRMNKPQRASSTAASLLAILAVITAVGALYLPLVLG